MAYTPVHKTVLFALAIAVLNLELVRCQFMTSSKYQMPKLGKRHVGGVFLLPKGEMPGQRVPWLYDSRAMRPSMIYINRINPAAYRSLGWPPSNNEDEDDKFEETKRAVYWNLE